MKKIAAILFCFFTLGFHASAQSLEEGSAQQTVALGLSNALEIGFTATNTATGNTVSMTFTTPNHYQNGVTSANQAMRVRSNKNFNVTVKTASSNFSVIANGVTSVSSMPSSILRLRVTNNSTGGTLGSGFSGYKTLSASNQNMINNGVAGGNRTFNVNYRAIPGFAYPAGAYSVDVVFTATQQ